MLACNIRLSYLREDSSDVGEKSGFSALLQPKYGLQAIGTAPTRATRCWVITHPRLPVITLANQCRIIWYGALQEGGASEVVDEELLVGMRLAAQLRRYYGS